MEAIVLAGGLGTRLQSVISEIPKPMAPIGDRSFLHYLLQWLEKNKITRVILSVGYKWEVIHDEFGDHFNQMELIYSVEDEPLGTGGAIALAMQKLKDEKFFIINGDTFFDVDLDELVQFHEKHHFDFSIILKPMFNFDRYGTVEINDQAEIIGFLEKEPKENGLINGGIYRANRSIEKHFPEQAKFSFEKAFMEKKFKELAFGGLVLDNYFIDIGIPEDYSRAQEELPKQ